ncbi:MAG TPA: D-2-hydroxyacid dehydrogenase [Xanthomonadales bacterium]|nr:D-2-hydroxyacid dehydrogenase [Xanthomonadales bacterium]
MSYPVRIAVFIVLALVAGVVAAKGVAPDPRATALIQELGLEASPTASRDLPGWQAPKRVVVAEADDDLLNRLRAAAPGVEIVAAAEGDARTVQLAGAQVVIGLCDVDTLQAAKALHWIQSWYVGVERCVALPGLAERHVVLTNMQRASGIPIAEHAIAMVMTLARGLPQYARQQHWQRGDTGAVRELTGRTLLVVGLGGIGTEVARRAHGLGMRVVATRNSSREGPDFVARVGLSDELLALAAEADVVVNCVPLTPATTDLFNGEFFAAMKPGGYFVNIARGGSVVTGDLVAALRSGKLAGAGLDVTDPEPLPDGHPLWSMPNVIVTPHVAGASDLQEERSRIVVVENLRRYAAGEPLLNVVDIARGY